MTYNFQAILVEICQYIEVCGQCISAVHVLVISASPENDLPSSTISRPSMFTPRADKAAISSFGKSPPTMADR